MVDFNRFCFVTCILFICSAWTIFYTGFNLSTWIGSGLFDGVVIDGYVAFLHDYNFFICLSFIVFAAMSFLFCRYRLVLVAVSMCFLIFSLTSYFYSLNWFFSFIDGL